MAEQYKIATLNNDAIQKIQTFEKETGKQLLALETGIQIADLSEKQLNELRKLEKDLSVVLLAYDS